MILRLKDKRPDDVQIIADNADGTIMAHLPVEWLRIVPKKKMDLTDEQRQAISNRLNS